MLSVLSKNSNGRKRQQEVEPGCLFQGSVWWAVVRICHNASDRYLKKFPLILFCCHSGGVTKSSSNGWGTEAEYEPECCQIVLSGISPWWKWLFYKSLTTLHLKCSVWFKWVELKEISLTSQRVISKLILSGKKFVKSQNCKVWTWPGSSIGVEANGI